MTQSTRLARSASTCASCSPTTRCSQTSGSPARSPTSRRSSSGHFYFIAADDEGQLRSVMWRSYAVRIAAHAPQAGDAVVAHGKLDFYPPQGTCQLVVDLLYPAGVGEGQLRFEALRLKLEQEGLFAEERKRPLPPSRGGSGWSPPRPAPSTTTS